MYKANSHGDGIYSSYVRQIIDDACPVSSERDAAMESTILFMMGLCFSKCIGTYIKDEMDIMRSRVQFQVNTPERRKHLLEFNKLLAQYEKDVWDETVSPSSDDESDLMDLEIPSDFYQVWILRRYRDYLRMIEENVVVLTESSNLDCIPESVSGQIVMIGNIIKDELYNL
jgi:hypothetical protein